MSQEELNRLHHENARQQAEIIHLTADVLARSRAWLNTCKNQTSLGAGKFIKMFESHQSILISVPAEFTLHIGRMNSKYVHKICKKRNIA